MEKGVRTRIAAKHPGVLKHDGLTVREHAGAKAYASMPPAVRLENEKRGKETFKRLAEGKTPK